MTTSATAGERLIAADALGRLIKELSRRISQSRLAKEVGKSGELQQLLRQLEKGEEISHRDAWSVIRVALNHGFFGLLPAHGVPSVSYDVAAPFNLVGHPLGIEEDVPNLPLIKRRTKIAGFPVDYPLGLPASVLASNAKWIEFYARRGFDILTYKTVRSKYREVHSWPQWVFLEDATELSPAFDKALVGEPGYLPPERAAISMANSFGVPSLAPDWWQDDIREARAVVREGHQVLIVSVTASTEENNEAIIADFVNTAKLAKDAGADIVEANFSCPNVPGEHKVGLVYQSPTLSAKISEAMQEVLQQGRSKTPLFVKIGYLPGPELRQFVHANAKFINGVVAINTITAKVIDKKGEDTFPGRPEAGISGWAIKPLAQEVARNLVALREAVFNDHDKHLTIVGVGGVLTKHDCSEYLDDIGVDAVESCTGAFLNPYLGLEVRAAKERPSRVEFEFKVIGTFLEDVFLHPTRPSHIKVNRETRGVAIGYE